MLNDAFGALTCSLQRYLPNRFDANDYAPDNCSDSYTAHLASEHNFALNQLPGQPRYIASTAALSGSFDLVLLKIPKSLALLEHQLIALQPCLRDTSIVLAAAMTKYLHKSHLALFEKYLGPTTTSLAVKKARLILPQFIAPASPVPTPQVHRFQQAELGLELCNYANVFSRDKLDIGARFMIENFDQLPQAQRIIDLGCGNGVLGIVAKQTLQKQFNVSPELYFVDESYMAVASAKETYLAAFGDDRGGNFLLSDCLQQVDASAIDLILCNPPFHQNHAVGDQIAWRMFNHSKRALNSEGQLWVIGNRHMQYHAKLKRLFGHCRTVAANKKFVLLAAHR